MTCNRSLIGYFLWVFCPLLSLLIADKTFTLSVQFACLLSFVLFSSIEELPKGCQVRLSSPMLFTLGWSLLTFGFCWLVLRCLHILLTATWTFVQWLATDSPGVFWFVVVTFLLVLSALSLGAFVFAVGDASIDDRLFKSLLLSSLVLLVGVIAVGVAVWLPDEFSSPVTSFLVSPFLEKRQVNPGTVSKRSSSHPLVVQLDFIYKVVTLLAYAVAAYTVVRRCFLPVVQTFREFRFGTVVKPVSERPYLTHSHWYGRVGIQRPDPVVDSGPSVAR
jgi:hypothetical protein